MSENNKKSNDGNISISDAIKLQDSYRKDIDFDKPDSELTTEEAAKKAIYLALDEAIEGSVGSEVKKDIDEKRQRLNSLQNFQKKLGKVVELGREIEKNLFWQNIYLINHFDKSEENYFRQTIDALTEKMIAKENSISNQDRLNVADKIMEIISVYRKKVTVELDKKQEIIKALLPAFENTLEEIDFELYGKEVEDTNGAKKMKTEMIDWLELTKQLVKSRSKAISAIEEHLEMDELLPKFVIENNGDVDGNLSSGEMISKGRRVQDLLGESNEVEKDIESRRSQISEGLFGKVDDYVNIENEVEDTKEEQIPNQQNLLESKAWYRLAKVVYIFLWILGVGLALIMWDEAGLIGFLFTLMIVWGILAAIKKAILYIVLGK